jgi:hypothetical protein
MAMMAKETTARETRERAATRDMNTGVIRAGATKVGFF